MNIVTNILWHVVEKLNNVSYSSEENFEKIAVYKSY